MKIIAFGDIHQIVAPSTYEAVIKAENPDRVIFLGDYFNDRGDGPKEAAASARWLLKGLDDPRRIFLVGNHDLHYLFSIHPQAHAIKAVHTEEKYHAIGSVIRGEQQRFDVAVFEHPFLFTHAGWRPAFAEFDPLTIHQAKSALQALKPHAFFSWSRETGGPDLVDGPLWARPDEDMLIPSIIQVFGHTHYDEPLILLSSDGNAMAVGIDCRHRREGPRFYFLGETGDNFRAEIRRVDGSLLIDLKATARQLPQRKTASIANDH